MKSIGSVARHIFATILFAVLIRGQAMSPPSAPATPPAESGDVLIKNVMVPMRDGVRLATDVYLPARNGSPAAGRFPVLVCRTPYGKTPSTPGPRNAGDYFARRGYAVVIQDCRGRYNSQGEFYIDVNEGADGYDTVEWAARQPWSNGKVGTYGASYLSQAQNALAVLRPPHLDAMFVMVGASDYYEEGAYRGGAFALLHNLYYALTLAATGHEAQANLVRQAALRKAMGPQFGAWLRAYPFRPNASPLLLAPLYEHWFQDFVDHPYFDDYWKQNGFDFEVSYARYPDIPIYFISGWYDLFLRGTLHNYAGLRPLHKSMTKLMIGPWVHNVGPRFAGNVDFGPTAMVDMLAEEQRWFDQVLKGKDTGVLSEPPVRLFVMGGGPGTRSRSGLMEDGGEWISTTAWPPPQAENQSYYLHGDGGLTRQIPGAEAPTTFAFDPAHPVPTIGGQIDSGKSYSPDGPRDQRCNLTIPGCNDDLPLSARRDVLVFQTPPLVSSLVIAGPVKVNLWISSSAPDTDFTAKLIDVTPPSADYPLGYAMNLADRIVRVRTSENTTKPILLRPGEIREVTIDLLGVANRFEAGHRIRLDISSSNFPFFDVNPNTGEAEGRQTHQAVAINSVYHDVAHASRIVLPTIPDNR
ncbi:MAG TPA: CocE/NonD family hydrolase [Terriglobia bacterium]|nr:CocE/NonD family hydrolase [Terriglobia bacterium]